MALLALIGRYHRAEQPIPESIRPHVEARLAAEAPFRADIVAAAPSLLAAVAPWTRSEVTSTRLMALGTVGHVGSLLPADSRRALASELWDELDARGDAMGDEDEDLARVLALSLLGADTTRLFGHRELRVRAAAALSAGAARSDGLPILEAALRVPEDLDTLVRR